jgi:hypothetical protein
MINRTLILIFVVSSCAFAQGGGNAVFYQSGGPVGVAGGVGTITRGPATPVQGAPYSATITNETVQTLADGNRIVQTSTGTTARDSQGRTRQDTALPAIGILSAANGPHLVFIQDPVGQASYTLNLTDKTAQKIPMPFAGAAGSVAAGAGTGVFFMQLGNAAPATAPLPPPPLNGFQQGVVIQKGLAPNEPTQESTEDLEPQTMEGVFVKGVRTTRTIPAGQIGNDKPISIVTEVWTSPDLKTIVYSKRSDPRMGEQTFQLKNIVRTEPDPSLFTVPADFKIIDGPQNIIYRSNQ